MCKFHLSRVSKWQIALQIYTGVALQQDRQNLTGPKTSIWPVFEIKAAEQRNVQDELHSCDVLRGPSSAVGYLLVVRDVYNEIIKVDPGTRNKLMDAPLLILSGNVGGFSDAKAQFQQLLSMMIIFSVFVSWRDYYTCLQLC